jgi:hypothetical protein
VPKQIIRRRVRITTRRRRRRGNGLDPYIIERHWGGILEGCKTLGQLRARLRKFCESDTLWRSFEAMGLNLNARDLILSTLERDVKRLVK